MSRPVSELLAELAFVRAEAEAGTPVSAAVVGRALIAAGELLAQLAARVAALESAAAPGA